MRTCRTLLLLLAVIIAGCSSTNQASRIARKPILVDEFSVLDDQKANRPLSDQVLKRKLDDARRHYVQAMRASEEGNATSASRHFESAMAILNDLITYPDIYNNAEFTKLSESLVQDYEETVTSLDSLDANSSFFVLRDKIFQEVERIPVDRQKYPANRHIATTGTSEPVDLQIDMTDNTPVQQCITFFTSDKGRKFFQRWLERSGRFFPMYERVLAEEGVPAELKHLSMIESGLSTGAVSWAKAVGLWQFIPSTGQMYGLNINWSVDERRDPVKATRAAARYLKDLYNDLGDWHLALASYNCGPGRVKSAIAKANSRSYWDVRQYLPRETQQYVPLYIAASKIAMNPEAYGFTNINYDTPDAYDTVSVKGGLDLSLLAQAANITVEQIKTMNPALLRDKLPPVSAYTINVPRGTTRDLAARVEEAIESQPAPTYLTHKVAKGESVQDIAAKYGVSTSVVYEANGLNARSHLKNGATLRIPMLPGADSTASVYHATSDGNGGAAASTGDDHDGSRLDGAPAPTVNHRTAATQSRGAQPVIAAREEHSARKSVTTTSSRYETHKVRRGEALSTIADRYGVSMNDLRAWNPTAVRHGAVNSGTTLRIYSETPSKGDARRSSRAAHTAPKSYTVRKGESIAEIANRFGVSVRQLRSNNPRLSEKSIRAGAKIRIGK